MDPQNDPAFPIPTWQTTLDMIKETATVIVELKNQHSGDEDALAKILVCENRIKEPNAGDSTTERKRKFSLNFHVISVPSAMPHREHPLHSL